MRAGLPVDRVEVVLVNTVTPVAAASPRTAPAPGALQAVFQPPLGKYMAPPAPPPPGPSREVSSLVICGSAAGAILAQVGSAHAHYMGFSTIRCAHTSQQKVTCWGGDWEGGSYVH